MEIYSFYILIIKFDTTIISRVVESLVNWNPILYDIFWKEFGELYKLKLEEQILKEI